MALVNEGERVLNDPISRARYLATGSANVSETGGTVDSTFLNTIFELQMRAMEDDESVQDEAETLMSLCEQRLQEIFEGWENGSEDLSEVEECLGRMKYLNNLIHR